MSGARIFQSYIGLLGDLGEGELFAFFLNWFLHQRVLKDTGRWVVTPQRLRDVRFRTVMEDLVVSSRIMLTC